MAELSNQSKKFKLYGRIFSELAECNRYIPNGVAIRYKFIAANNSFSTMGSAATPNLAVTEPKLKILSATLFVRHVQLSPGVFNAINKSLQISNMIFPIKRRNTVTYNLTSGQSHFVLDNIFMGSLPDQLIFGFVEHSASNGDYTRDPLCFKSFNLNYISVFFNNKPYPSMPWTPNFTTDSYEREYFDFHNELGLTLGIGVLDLTYKNYKSHFCLFSVNFNQDYSNTTTDYVCLSREGTIRLELKFETDLTSALKLVCVGRIDSNIEIDKHRNILLDF